MKKLLFFILILMLSAQASIKRIYVSTNGDDANGALDGVLKPVKTLEKAFGDNNTRDTAIYFIEAGEYSIASDLRSIYCDYVAIVAVPELTSSLETMGLNDITPLDSSLVSVTSSSSNSSYPMILEVCIGSMNAANRILMSGIEFSAISTIISENQAFVLAADTVELYGCGFTNNSVQFKLAQSYFLYLLSGEMVIRDCKLNGNSLSSGTNIGGEPELIRLGGGTFGSPISQMTHTELSQNSFTSDRDSVNATLIYSKGSIEIDSSSITENSGLARLVASPTSPSQAMATVSHSLISGNSAAVQSETSGTFQVINARCLIENSVFYRNNGVFFANMDTIRNSIFVEDSLIAGSFLSCEFTNSVSYDTIWDKTTILTVTTTLPYQGVVVDSSGIFLDPDNGDFHVYPWSKACQSGSNVGIYTDIPAAPAGVGMFSKTALDYKMLSGQSVTDTIVITNSSSGDSALYLYGTDSIVVTGDDQTGLSFTLSPAFDTLDAGKSCSLIVTYDCNSLGENKSFVFHLQQGMQNRGDSVVFSVESDPAKSVTNFITVNDTVIWGDKTLYLPNSKVKSAVDSVVIKNTSTLKALPVDSLVLTNTNGSALSIPLSSQPINVTIAAQDSLVIPVQFESSVVGTYTADLRIYSATYNSGVSVVQKIDKSYKEASFTNVTAGIDFGTLLYSDGISKVDSISMTNSGEVPIYISAVSVAGSDLISITKIGGDAISLPDTVAAGVTRRYVVTYAPTAVGSLKDTVTILNDGVLNSTIKIPLTGSAITQDFGPVESVLDFGSVPVFETGKDSIDVINNGSGTITITTVTSYESAITLGGSYNKTVTGNGGTSSIPLNFTLANPKGGEVTSGQVEVFYTDNSTGVDSSFSVICKGKVVADPVVSIDSISPDTVEWDTAATISFYATANDSDIVGSGTIAYLWTANGDTLATSANPKVRPSDLLIGDNTLYLTVTDDEGATAIDSAVVTVIGGKPIASIDSITPRSVIIRDGQNMKFFLTAKDTDAEGDPTVTVQWYSTIDGALKVVGDSLDPSGLSVGVHNFYTMVVDNEGDTAYSDTLEIPVQNSMGRAIIVTGHAFGETDYFFNNIAPNANIAYKRLRDRGYSNEQIYYMNPVSWQSIDGDPMSSSGIVDDTTMTKANLQAHLTSIAGDIKSDIPLVIYLLGHGSNTDQNNAKFYLNDSAYIDPTTLNTWLDDAFGKISGNKSYITIIADFCYSGGFVNGLKSSTQNRAVVTSADAGTPAYFSRGKSFATSIFNQVYRGQELKTCFESAQLWSEQNAPGGNKANPQIDCNGDGIVNSDEDLNIASTIYLGGAHNLQSPYSESDSVSVVVTDGVASVEALIKGEINSVSVRVVPVDGALEDVDFGMLPLFELTRDAQDTTKWVGEYSAFPANGEYLLLVEGVYGIDQAMLSIGKVVTVGETAIIVRDAPAKLFFNPAQYGGVTQLNFGLPVASDVRINIYDLRGRVVQQIVKTGLRAGYYSIPMSDLLGAGFYITQFSAGSANITSKMVVR